MNLRTECKNFRSGIAHRFFWYVKFDEVLICKIICKTSNNMKLYLSTKDKKREV